MCLPARRPSAAARRWLISLDTQQSISRLRSTCVWSTAESSWASSPWRPVTHSCMWRSLCFTKPLHWAPFWRAMGPNKLALQKNRTSYWNAVFAGVTVGFSTKGQRSNHISTSKYDVTIQLQIGPAPQLDSWPIQINEKPEIWPVSTKTLAADKLHVVSEKTLDRERGNKYSSDISEGQVATPYAFDGSASCSEKFSDIRIRKMSRVLQWVLGKNCSCLLPNKTS